MNLENYYYYFTEAVPKVVCDDIIRYGEQQDQRIGVTGSTNHTELTEKSKKKLFKQRNSSIVFMTDPWIYNQIIPYINEANASAGWMFKLDRPESLQWTKYAKSQHYDWHMDSYPKAYNNNEYNGKVRKLSMTLTLNDGDEYEGGDLQFNRNSPNDKELLTNSNARKKGTITVFPSFVYHRVTPVKKGTRYSLVAWVLGKPFV